MILIFAPHSKWGLSVVVFKKRYCFKENNLVVGEYGVFGLVCYMIKIYITDNWPENLALH